MIPTGTTRIALIYYADGEKSYILSPVGLQVDDWIQAGPGSEIKPGELAPPAEHSHRHGGA